MTFRRQSVRRPLQKNLYFFALKKRKEEHENNNSAVAVMNVHKGNYNHYFQWENIKILDFECNWYKRIISKMMHIK